MAARSSRFIAIAFWLTATFFVYVLFNHGGGIHTPRLPHSLLKDTSSPAPVGHSSTERPSSIHDDATNVEESDYVDWGTPKASFVPQSAAPAAAAASSSSKILNITQRMARSEKSWQTSIDTRHEIRAQYFQAKPEASSIPFFDGNRMPSFPGGGAYYTIWDWFTPAYTCPWDIQRVGRFADGGKWVCGMTKYEEEKDRNLIIYSFGVEQDSAFEEAMLSNTNAEIFAFDFSVDGFGDQLTAAHKNRSHFSKVGLSNQDETARDPPFRTLASLMQLNGHDYIDILKVDVEGAEFDALDRFMDDFEGKTLPIGQLMIELHLFDDAKVSFERFYQWWERFESFGMRPTYLEINLIQVVFPSQAPDKNPRCTEIVWVNPAHPKNILWQE